jgi:hypothetical protein
MITYFSQWFFIEQRFFHPLEQTTFLCYDNGKGGFQTAFFSGTVQATPKTEKANVRSGNGASIALIQERTESWTISTGYWDDSEQLKRYLRILSSPKVYLLDWNVETVDKIILEPVAVKTTSIALPADIQTSNAFVLEVERLLG